MKKIGDFEVVQPHPTPKLQPQRRTVHGNGRGLKSMNVQLPVEMVEALGIEKGSVLRLSVVVFEGQPKGILIERED